MVSLWYESWCTGIKMQTKVCVCTRDLKILNLSKWILVVDILTQILLTLLTFIALPILWKNQFVADGLSLVWVIMHTFNLYLEELSMDNNMVSRGLDSKVEFMGSKGPVLGIPHPPKEKNESWLRACTKDNCEPLYKLPSYTAWWEEYKCLFETIFHVHIFISINTLIFPQGYIGTKTTFLTRHNKWKLGMNMKTVFQRINSLKFNK